MKIIIKDNAVLYDIRLEEKLFDNIILIHN